ncbi:uncharacterized protein LOC127813254 [Diospyros lotus]|uniref:uncharacterized protein LOC127813254 n=1 Tax=Diospyros lotus TaxID=55363 RepID=UPI0022597E0C|nr:uncharacterized protein LOC127813254 [Diospyros lotus]
MDCTYKTNRYRYPLLQIVGVTSTELTFPVAFAFMDHEYEDNYTWAMERLQSLMGSNIFPRVVVTDRELALINAIHKVAESAHAKLKRHLGSSQGDFESSWTIINSLIELQHTEIKGSFEKSLTLVQHNFKPEIFRELRGIISRNAMNMVLKETQIAQKIGVDKISCGCVIRSTHGLPCAHEIAEFIIQGRPIPLSVVHSHWRKLHLMQTSCDEDISSLLMIEPEIDTIYKKFQLESEAGKLVLKQKLRELVDPATTSLMAPSVKVKTKGKPSSKKKYHFDSSTKRDPSYFEIVQSSHDNTTPVIHSSSKIGKECKHSKSRVNVKYRLRGYDDSFPPNVQYFIHNIMNVDSDGHCGFRAIAALLGMSEQNWGDIRLNLIEELHVFRAEYSQLYGSNMRVDELMHALSCFESVAPPQHWMTLPDMGHLIASKYNVVLIHLSRLQCLTYLPLRSVPPPSLQHRIISIGFVNDCHFVQVFLKPNSPIPHVALK